MHNQILRKMTPEQKLNAASALYFSARQFKAAWIRQQNPEWSEEQIQQEVKDIFMRAGAKES